MQVLEETHDVICPSCKKVMQVTVPHIVETVEKPVVKIKYRYPKNRYKPRKR